VESYSSEWVGLRLRVWRQRLLLCTSSTFTVLYHFSRKEAKEDFFRNDRLNAIFIQFQFQSSQKELLTSSHVYVFFLLLFILIIFCLSVFWTECVYVCVCVDGIWVKCLCKFRQKMFKEMLNDEQGIKGLKWFRIICSCIISWMWAKEAEDEEKDENN
jgi:hypothetical protein